MPKPMDRRTAIACGTFSLLSLSGCLGNGKGTDLKPTPPDSETPVSKTDVKTSDLAPASGKPIDVPRKPESTGNVEVIDVVSKAPEWGRFTSQLKLEPRDCRKTKACTVSGIFAFQAGSLSSQPVRAWESDKLVETDGASIPEFAQDAIGKPFDLEYLPAAIIHDWYCKRRVQGFLHTHLVFHDMLRALGVKPQKAKIMFVAVLIGGPRWFGRRPGENCQTLEDCVRVAPPIGARLQRNPQTNAEEILGVDQSAAVTNQRAAAFEEMRLSIGRNPNVSLDNIGAQASEMLPRDRFLANRDRIEMTIEEYDEIGRG